MLLLKNNDQHETEYRSVCYNSSICSFSYEGVANAMI